MLPLRLFLLSLLIAASTVLHVLPLLLVALLKALLLFRRPAAGLQRRADRDGGSWIGVNGWMYRFTQTRIDLGEDAPLARNGHYLVLANHQSWVDILVLQKVFNRRIPFMRFFLEEGSGCRCSAWHGGRWTSVHGPLHAEADREASELAGRDIESTRRACEKFARRRWRS